MLEDWVSDRSDPLSVALTKMKLRAFTNVALDAGGRWAVDFPAYAGLTLNVVQKGECWLSIKGNAQVVCLRAGDCFLLTGGREFTLATDLSLGNRFRAEEVFPQAEQGIARCNGGGDFFVFGIFFRFQGHLSSLLWNRLPAIIHVDGSSDHAAVLRGSLDRFNAEIRSGGVGRSLILSHLAPIMLLQTLRYYLAFSPQEENWLVALTHPRLVKVLEAMQTDYKRDWSLEQLAKVANMSRSNFALTFQKKVGVSPMVYLMNWRMQIACELLEAGDQNLALIAGEVGYRSESAFSTAFTRAVKCRPGNYRSPRTRHESQASSRLPAARSISSAQK